MNTLDILFFGDIVGRSGRQAVSWYLESLTESDAPDVVIANVENATHGYGLSEKNYRELRQAGVDIMTGGNHIWDRKELLDFIHQADYIVRPANFPARNPGVGAKVFEIRGHLIGVLNLIGQVYMGNYNSPWEAMEQYIPEMQETTPIIFIDCHAEATAEKLSLAYCAAQMGVSAFTGTHTHVQTADERILLNQMGYITDTGFNGVYDSIIGMTIGPGIEKLKSLTPGKIEVADSHIVQINATRYRIQTETGVCQSVERINFVHDLQSSRQVVLA